MAERTQEKSGAMPGSAASLAQSLHGIDFPAKKDDLVRYAQDHSADDSVLEKLRNLPNANFTNMADVMKGLGEEKRRQ